MIRAGLLLAALLLFATEASAQLVVAPPILGKTIKPPASVIERAVQEELEEIGIDAMKRTKRTTARLAKCQNKMSCLASVGKQVGASHVLHVIVAQRDDEVLAQLTLLSVHTKKPVDVARAKTTNVADAIDRTIRGAARIVGLTMAKLPEFADDSIRMDPMAGQTPTGPVPPQRAEPEPDDDDDVERAGLPPLPPAGDPGRPARTEPERTEPAFAPAARPAEPARTAAPPPVVIAPAPVDDGGSSTLTYVVGGTAIAAGIVGGVMLALARSDATARDETPQIELERRQELHDAALGKQTAGIALMIGAGVGLSAALLIELLSGDGSDDGSAVLTAGPSGLAFEL